jgi:hypothetical protein
MRDYGKVFSRIWESQDFRRLSEDGQKLVLYLLTCTHGTLAGVFRVPDGYACEDLQWSSERVSKGFQELLANSFATRCERTKWVWVFKYLDWNPLENPNQRKAAVKIAQQVPSDCLWNPGFIGVCGDLIGLQMAEDADRFETLPEPFLNQYQEQYQDQQQEKEQVATPAPTAQAPRPRLQKSTEPPKTSFVWEAYATAYDARYGAAPVRNQKTNSQLSQFIDRLGANVAPAVAAFYVGHSNAYYVRNMHPVGLLLADAEKLHTEWQTNRRMTDTQARQVDKTATNGDVFQRLIEEAQEEDRRRHEPH